MSLGCSAESAGLALQERNKRRKLQNILGNNSDGNKTQNTTRGKDRKMN